MFLREHLTRNKVLGIALALIGVAVVLGHGNPLHLVSGGIGIGEIVMFGCPLSWAANTLIARRMLPAHVADRLDDVVGAHRHRHARRSSPRSPARCVPEGVSWRAWAAIVFIAHLRNGDRRSCCSTTACAAIGAARTSVFINLVPVFAVALGVLLLGEPLEASMLVGGALVIGGIFLLNRPERAARRRASHAA